MANQNVKARIQIRYDTAANWAITNPVLLAGEKGIESDTLKEKTGNGTTTWNSLPYTNYSIIKRCRF